MFMLTHFELSDVENDLKLNDIQIYVKNIDRKLIYFDKPKGMLFEVIIFTWYVLGKYVESIVQEKVK